MNLDENEAFTQIQAYHNEPKNQGKILLKLLEALGGVTVAERQLQRARLSELESRSEAALALLTEFKVCMQNGNAKGLEERFRKRIRQQLRQYSRRRLSTSPIKESYVDPKPTPSAEYSNKEQLAIITKFLNENFKQDDVTVFLEKFADGKPYREISIKHRMSIQGLQKKLMPMLDKVQRYMKRVNNG